MNSIPNFRPTKGTFGATIVSLHGVACAWQASNGIELEVAVTKLTSSQLAANQKRVAIGSTSTIVFGRAPRITGYSVNSGGTYTGDLEVFTDTGYWISAVSPRFLNPGDGASVIGGILQVVPAA